MLSCDVAHVCASYARTYSSFIVSAHGELCQSNDMVIIFLLFIRYLCIRMCT